MNVSDTIAQRKSVRAYLAQPVSADDVEKVVEAGRWAPNAGPFHISVLRRPELKQRLNDTIREAMLASSIEFLRMRAGLPGYQPLYGAPVAILISGPASSPYTGVNCALAAENMILQATESGLASCLIVAPSLALGADAALAQEAGLPEDFVFQCGVLVGYPAATDPYSNPERDRKGTISYID